MTLRKGHQEGRERTGKGVKNKVIGRWKASRQKMEVEHVRFLSCDSYIFPKLRPIMGARESVTLLLMIIDWTW